MTSQQLRIRFHGGRIVHGANTSTTQVTTWCGKDVNPLANHEWLEDDEAVTCNRCLRAGQC